MRSIMGENTSYQPSFTAKIKKQLFQFFGFFFLIDTGAELDVFVYFLVTIFEFLVKIFRIWFLKCLMMYICILKHNICIQTI